MRTWLADGVDRGVRVLVVATEAAAVEIRKRVKSRPREAAGGGGGGGGRRPGGGGGWRGGRGKGAKPLERWSLSYNSCTEASLELEPSGTTHAVHTGLAAHRESSRRRPGSQAASRQARLDNLAGGPVQRRRRNLPRRRPAGQARAGQGWADQITLASCRVLAGQGAERRGQSEASEARRTRRIAGSVPIGLGRAQLLPKWPRRSRKPHRQPSRPRPLPLLRQAQPNPPPSAGRPGKPTTFWRA
ncbi:uncharacterized protein PSFLO_06950 [Pseudozyma flocculosa]|uniref:Uncharacterized protein n=1 Tax=Pseudozyma flocculosa TaxID=84751 RepID=A0A5C3FAI2_9BASI|nr:uncharacterized protein PSFLO_06950 [Pseudozyma flocculosa]